MSLSLAGGASAATGGAAADLPAHNTAVNYEITLGEEDISGVSLGTFYVFDKENAAALRQGIKVARCGCRCGCGGCGCGCGGALWGYGCGYGYGCYPYSYPYPYPYWRGCRCAGCRCY